MRQHPRSASAIEWARATQRSLGLTPESEAYLQATEAWRAAWRPDRVRVLLVAESHVAEQPGDAGVTVDTGRLDLPQVYCRLVYCLGYGEATLCRPRSPANNRGTPQYWRIFATLAAGVQQRGPRGLAQKNALLNRLRDLGVWLVDACVAGIYCAGSRIVPASSYSAVLRESYQSFVLPCVATDAPQIVYVIGKGVYDALVGLPLIKPGCWLYQPNARGEQGQRHREQLLELATLVHRP